MFSKKPTETLQGTIIGVGASFRGEIATGGLLRIDGRVEGKIRADGDLVVGEQGMVKAEIQAKNITIGGWVEGQVTARGKLELLAKGKLYGDARMKMMAVEDGAVFQGQCLMTVEKEENSRDSTGESERDLSRLGEQVEALMQGN